MNNKEEVFPGVTRVKILTPRTNTWGWQYYKGRWNDQCGGVYHADGYPEDKSYWIWRVGNPAYGPFETLEEGAAVLETMLRMEMID